MSLPSKRDFLASVINPETNLPYAKAGVVGKFSNAANAYAEAHKDKWAAEVKVTPTPRANASTTPKVKVDTSKVDPKEVREWAAQNGHAVNARGRLPHAVVTAFLKADGAVTVPAARTIPSEPVVRPEHQGFILEGNTLLVFDLCASQGGCGKRVNRRTCPTGPRAPHYLPGDLSNAVLTLDKP